MRVVFMRLQPGELEGTSPCDKFVQTDPESEPVHCEAVLVTGGVAVDLRRHVAVSATGGATTTYILVFSRVGDAFCHTVRYNSKYSNKTI